MINTTELYDNMCRVLTDYEELTKDDYSKAYECMTDMYNVLVDIQNNWELLKEDD